MSENHVKGPLIIKKYANRRFYNAADSRHVTLSEMHDLICAGHELTITDCKTGDDITNVVLTQIILEKDPPKLEIFPATVLHQVIRTQQELLGTVVEQFFAKVLEAHRTSQEQWSRFLRNTLGMGATIPPNPTDWTRSMMEAFVPPTHRPSKPEPTPQVARHGNEMDVLRRQVAELSSRVQRLTKTRGRK